MALLSRETEQDFIHDVLKMVGNYLEVRETVPKKQTGLIPQQELKDELGISFQTLTSWEKAGLKRYQPPLEDTRKVFYKISDILVFLGVENG